LIIPALTFAAFESYPISTTNVGFGKMALSSKGNFIDMFYDPSSLIHFSKVGGEGIWNKPFQINELQQTAFATGFKYKNWGFRVRAQWQEFDFAGTPDLYGALVLEVLL